MAGRPEGEPSLVVDRPDRLLRERVVDVIREAIMRGDLAPGRRLTDKELVERTGVSRTSLREALRQLEAEGLVERRAAGGLQVTAIGTEDIRRLFEVRAALEPAAVTLFVQNASDEEVAALVECDVSSGEVEEALGDLKRFYEVLLAGTKNPILEQMFASVMARLHVMRRMSLRVEGRMDLSRAELRKIVDAVKVRDAAAAADLARVHVENARVSVLRAHQESL